MFHLPIWVALASISLIYAEYCPRRSEINAALLDPEICAILYEDDGCQSHSLTVEPNTEETEIASLRTERTKWNDKISSVFVRPGCELSLYWDKQFGGRLLSLNESSDMRTHNFNDKTSSYKCRCWELPKNVVGKCDRLTGEWKILMKCQATNLEGHNCAHRYSVGTSISERAMKSRDDTLAIQVGGEVNYLETYKATFSVTNSRNIHVENEKASSTTKTKETETSITVPVGTTGTIKQAYAECGNVTFLSELTAVEYTDNITGLLITPAPPTTRTRATRKTPPKDTKDTARGCKSMTRGLWKTIDTCQGSSADAHKCSHKYKIGTYVDGRELHHNDKGIKIKIGKEIVPLNHVKVSFTVTAGHNAHVTHTISKSTVKKEKTSITVPVPAKKTAVIKQVYSKCGDVTFYGKNTYVEYIDLVN